MSYWLFRKPNSLAKLAKRLVQAPKWVLSSLPLTDLVRLGLETPIERMALAERRTMLHCTPHMQVLPRGSLAVEAMFSAGRLDMYPEGFPTRRA